MHRGVIHARGKFQRTAPIIVVAAGRLLLGSGLAFRVDVPRDGASLCRGQQREQGGKSSEWCSLMVRI